MGRKTKAALSRIANLQKEVREPPQKRQKITTTEAKGKENHAPVSHLLNCQLADSTLRIQLTEMPRRKVPQAMLVSKPGVESLTSHIWKLTELLYYCRYECDIGLCRWGQMIQLSNKMNSKKYSPS